MRSLGMGSALGRVAGAAGGLGAVAVLALGAVFACSDAPPEAPPFDAGTDFVPPGDICSASPPKAAFPTGGCTAPTPADKDAFDEALALIGRDRCTLQQDPKKMTNAVMDVSDP